MKNQILSQIDIRILKTVKELEGVRELEALVWSFQDSVPVNHTVAVVKNGGFILGAFLKEELIGFQYSFPGYDGEKVYLCSHSLGIHPNYRKYGIGEKLKWAQRELALEKGYPVITWTYDPLETVNGNLNLHKLGAVCSIYIEDAYGDMDDGLNSGIPTDRFLVEWQTEESKYYRVNPTGLPQGIQTSLKGEFLAPKDPVLSITENRLVVPVPGNFQKIKQDDFSLALNWRNVTRQVFSHYLTKGWQATDLVKDNDQDNQYFYLLEKRV